MTLEQALGLLGPAQSALGNPYEDPHRHQRALETLDARRRELPVAIGVLLDGHRAKEAGRLLLAMGLVELRAGDALLLDRQRAPEAWFTGTGIARAAAAATLAAAHRLGRELERMLGGSAALLRLKAQVHRVCLGPGVEGALHLARMIRDQNVLIVGETGTGKELVAAAIQAGTPPAIDGPPPVQSLSAAAIPGELLESELFGHKKGAFSDAIRDRTGKLVTASGGTFFLDEVADLPRELQPKLLRAIETNRVCPVGGNDELEVDIRYVSATCRPIMEMAERGEFRADLYERLAGAVIEVPPLRERTEDIRPIAEALVARLSGEPTPIAGLTPRSALESTWMRQARERLDVDMDAALRSHDWPGNVRELENFVRTRLLGLEDGRRRRPGPAALADSAGPRRPTPSSATNTTAAAAASSGDAGLPEKVLACQVPLREITRWYIERVLEHCQGNLTQAARILEVDRSTLSRQARKLGLAGSEE
jgi:DNA-binding NtrC family response regulator